MPKQRPDLSRIREKAVELAWQPTSALVEWVAADFGVSDRWARRLVAEALPADYAEATELVRSWRVWRERVPYSPGYSFVIAVEDLFE